MRKGYSEREEGPEGRTSSEPRHCHRGRRWQRLRDAGLGHQCRTSNARLRRFAKTSFPSSYIRIFLLSSFYSYTFFLSFFLLHKLSCSRLCSSSFYWSGYWKLLGGCERLCASLNFPKFIGSKIYKFIKWERNMGENFECKPEGSEVHHWETLIFHRSFCFIFDFLHSFSPFF